MNRDVEERIAAVAARQYGVVTRGQVVEAGMSPWAVSRRVTSGRFRQLHRGVYLVGPLTPLRAREMAAVLAAREGVVSHLSAASLRGMLQQLQSDPVDITMTRGNRGRRPGIRIHRVARLDEDERSMVDGIPVTTPTRTLADLAGVVGSRELELAFARAERAGLVSDDSLSEMLHRYRNRAGARLVRAVLQRRGGPALTRSEAEDKFLALVRAAALPPPETNVRIGSYEIDFLWRNEGIAVEVDGYRHHSSRSRFESDRHKDTWLLAGGIKVIRLSWQQITREGIATAVQVAQALALARRARG